MARAYAAMLGNTAFAVFALRGLARGELVYATVVQGLCALAIFTLIGYIVGAVGERLIRQSIEWRFREAVDNFGRELANRVVRVDGPVDS